MPLSDMIRTWFPVRITPPEARWCLVCLPFAGGTALYYRDWHRHMPADAALWAAELPGHGIRLPEPLIADMDDLAEALAEAIAASCDLPLVLFGHSMGSAIALATARVLDGRGPAPRLIVASGRSAPHLVAPRSIHTRNDAGLRAEMIRLSGTDHEILNNAELMSFILPVVRNDFRLIETWKPAPTPKVAAPVLVLSGRDDTDITKEGLEGWAAVTRSWSRVRLFDGGHFYLSERPQEAVQAIVDAAAPHVRQVAMPVGAES